MMKLTDELKTVVKEGTTFAKIDRSSEYPEMCKLINRDRIFTNACIGCNVKIEGELCCQITCNGSGACPKCDECDKR